MSGMVYNTASRLNTSVEPPKIGGNCGFTDCDTNGGWESDVGGNKFAAKMGAAIEAKFPTVVELATGLVS